MNDDAIQAIKLAAAIVDELDERLRPLAGIADDPLGADKREELADVCNLLVGALDHLAEGETEEAIEELEAIAGALEPSLLEDDSDEPPPIDMDADPSHPEPKE